MPYFEPNERFYVSHVYCNAHLIRVPKDIYESTGQEWALDLRKLLV